MVLIPRPSPPAEVPVDPEAPEARDWLIEELAKDRYQVAQPSPFDEFVDWLTRLLDSLTVPVEGPGGLLGLVVVIGVVVVVLVIAFLVFGRPRLNRRSQVTGSLFGDDDERDAAGLRRAAERAAAGGDYTTAIVELFRALARGLAEREIVDTFPGTTARDFAARAGRVFPAERDRLADAGVVFDGVRYLDAVGRADQWAALVELERALRTARPTNAGEAVAGRGTVR